MDNIKNDFYYVKRLLRSIEITSRYLKDKSMDDLINDGFLCDAIENRFTKIAEDASNLSKDFKKNLLEVATVHKMNLYPDAFELIENGSKKVEMRLNDEKRQKLTIGDLVIFTNTKTKEEIIVEIIDLKTFNSFDELYSSYEKTAIGYKKDEVANPNDMLDYYSQEQIEKYGALAIEIKLYWYIPIVVLTHVETVVELYRK